MARFFTSPENISKNKIELSKDDVFHIANVLRMKEGERIIVCDTKGHDYECEIKKISKKDLSLEIINKEKTDTEPNVKVTLYQGIPKQDKMELIIQKAVEIGINKIVPIETERIIAKLKDKEDKKINRWQKISESAAKQSGRGIIPQIGNVMSFKDAIKTANESRLGLIPYELEREYNLKSALKGFKGDEISIFIGPEGGFSEDEIKYAKENNILPITLGKRILRTETAGIVAVAIIMHEIGEM